MAITNLIVVPSVATSELAGVAEIILRRENYQQGMVRLIYATEDVTAVAGQDYVEASGTVVWEVGDAEDKRLRVEILDDSWMESTEFFSLRLLSVEGGTAAAARAQVSIRDDDTVLQPNLESHRLLRTFSASSAAAAGDLDGDGSDDLVVGDASNGDRGRVRLVSGRTGRTLATITGSAGEYLGRHVAGVGDLDGDGRPDVVASAIKPVDLNWVLKAYSGRDARLLYAIEGSTLDHRGLSALAGLGDVNDDGTPDLLTGHARDTGRGPGFVSLYSGRDGRLLGGVQATSFGERFGSAVAGIGDLDGDGIDEFLVGAPGRVSVHVHSGASLVRLRTLTGNPNTGYGEALDAIGDVDGDGRIEIAVGEPSVQGLTGGKIHLYSTVDWRLVRTLSGGGDFGRQVSGVGDVDGDDRADILAADPSQRLVTVFSGSGGAMLAFQGVEPAFGSVAFAAGDTNDDGSIDLCVTGTGAKAYLLSTRRLMLVTDGDELSILWQLGRQSLFLDAGRSASGRSYLVAGSLGIRPGIDLGAVHLPLNPDVWFQTTVQFANSATLQGTRGQLDAQGKARAYIEMSGLNLSPFLGVTLFHAFLVHGSEGQIYSASNATPLTLVK